MLSLANERAKAKWSYSEYILLVHLVWVTKYRYPVLRGDIEQRCRELIIQICDSEDIRITRRLSENRKPTAEKLILARFPDFFR